MHAAKSLELEGRWSRCERYALRDGIIVPASTSHLGYDPWELYRSNVGKYRTVEQPYIGILELQRALEQAEARGVRPSHVGSLPSTGSTVKPPNEADQIILRWCNSHGLLGILSTLCSSICMPAIVKRLPMRHMRMVSQMVHFRDGGMWSSLNDLRIPITGSNSKLAAVAAQQEVAQRPKPGVAWLNRESHVYEHQPLDTIKTFFPDLSWKTGKTPLNVPCPNKADFWAEYCEPVLQFTHWCRLFTRAVEHLSGWAANPRANELDWKTIAVDRSFRTLSALAQSAAPSFRFNRGRNTMEEPRESAGLLGSYALMFLWDRMDGRRAIRCQNCERYFVSNEDRARYCKVSCRNTAQSRRSRAKKKAK